MILSIKPLYHPPFSSPKGTKANPLLSPSIPKASNMGHPSIIRIRALLLLALTVFVFVLAARVCNAACRPPCYGVAVTRAQEHDEDMEEGALDDETKDNDPYRMYGDVPSPGVGH
ncbi:hypothetical protein SDJN03_05181, partial [Cucurbita argyrosperma subsp. sororia]